MKEYENGTSTREIILDVGGRLFYEKGYHETSYNDICREAHVNRGSVYYHFRNKDDLRGEVLRDWVHQFICLAEQYCDRNVFLMGLYILWYKCSRDPKLWKFFLEYYKDFPDYDESAGICRFYEMSYRRTIEEVWPGTEISELGFKLAYSYVAGLARTLEDKIAVYEPLQVFRLCMTGLAGIWDIPRDRYEALWKEMQENVAKLPEDAILGLSVCRTGPE